MDQRTYHVVIAVIRRDGQLLMVEQQGPEDPHPYWALPGGLVEPGELLHEALIRETDEEAGLRVEAIAQLAYCTQIDHPQRSAQTVAFAFEITAWSGTPQVRDPDGEILQVAWAPMDEALGRLQELSWRGMREPMLAYLRGDSPPGVVWMYRESADDQIRLADITAADR